MFKSIKSAISGLGFTDGLLYLLGRALQLVSRGRGCLIRYYVVAQPIPHPFVPVCRRSENDKVTEITPKSSICKEFPRPNAVIRSRFERNFVCLAATSKQAFSGFLWFARSAYDEDEVRCRFVLANPDSMVWDFDVYVEPRFRLGRTFVRLWDAANERFSSNGIRWSISRISAFNLTSLQSHGHMGLRHLHTLTFICLGKLQIGLMSCSPYVSVSWNETDRPIVVIDVPAST